ncbi:AcrR family transcriptional regulator [Paenibacillus mucilaginosus]|uniref:TetR/AcrR family transcriptional regulator n=1 Tax=Paenibacillus mucilaginosus TaxID=61624 RepID=UPI003D221AFB
MTDRPPRDTDEKLLRAAVDLMADRGYNGVTTREIADAAGLSEKTLFRRFGTKRNLLETAFDRYHYGTEMMKLFHEKLVWELRTDLLLVARTYHTLMNANRKMILISIKDEGHLPGFRERTRKHPVQLMEGLASYFREMAGKGRMRPGDPELQAAAFLMLNFGMFMNDLEAGSSLPGIHLDPLIEESVAIFARGLAP